MRKKRIQIEAFNELHNLRFVYKPKPLLGPVATAIATAQRRLLKSGQKPKGGSIKRPEDGDRPLRDSGQLINSIRGKVTKYKGGYGVLVRATKGRDDSRLSNAALLAVQIHGRKTWNDRPRNPHLMTFAGPLIPAAKKAFEKSLQRQLARGNARIISGEAKVGVISRMVFGEDL